MDVQKEIYTEIGRNYEAYKEAEGVIDKYLVAHVKSQLFSCYDGTMMSRLPAAKKRQLDIDALCFIVTRVYCLTPEQLDSIWSRETLVRMGISALVKEIVNTADDRLKEATLFDRKQIILHECFPEYYACTYPERYEVLEVIRASGQTLRNLRKAGKIDAGTVMTLVQSDKDTGKARLGNSGEIVDRITYHALYVYLKTALGTMDMGEHFQALTPPFPGFLRLKTLGVVKIINSRGCWASLLDFYYLNSPEEIQKQYFQTYRQLRENSQDYDAISAFLSELA